MAIAFARASIYSRRKGHSAVAASAYRSGSKLYDKRTGITYDYTKRTDVKFHEILLPNNTNNNFEEQEHLWNTLEASEKRKDSQLCKELTLALPRELTLEQQIKLAKMFSHRYFVKEGLPCDIAIHDKATGNPHAHILIPLRRLERDSFSKLKARDLDPTIKSGFVVEKDYWGELWHDFQQQFFHKKGLSITVDINNIIPFRHYSKIKGANYLKEENRLIKNITRELSRRDIKNFIKLLSFKVSVFTEKDIKKLLSKIINLDVEAINQATHKVLAHRKVIKLVDDNGISQYTTTYHHKKEKKLFKRVDKLSKQKQHQATIGAKRISKQFNLSQEQSLALNYLLESSDIAVLSGKPGTGKTYLLKALNQQYQKYGYKILGAALASRAAKGLEAGSDIPSSTISSLNYRLNKGCIKLDKNHIIIIDEAGMVDFESFHTLIKYVTQARAKLILVGDSQQLKPIGKGDIFRGISDRIGYFSMEDIKRQKHAKDREASINLSKGNIQAALNHYDSKGALNFEQGEAQVIQKTIDNWSSDIKSQDIKDSILLSFTRKSVLKLNLAARNKIKSHKKLGDDEYIYPVIRSDDAIFDKKGAKLTNKLKLEYKKSQQHNKILLANGERILFKKKDKTLGVDNGDLATITDIRKNHIKAQLDSGKTIQFKNGQYQHFDYAYALTVHKSQGMSIENAHLVIDSPYWDKHLSYVAMTRHKEKLAIYANTEQCSSKLQLAKSLSSNKMQRNSLDMRIHGTMKNNHMASPLCLTGNPKTTTLSIRISNRL